MVVYSVSRNASSISTIVRPGSGSFTLGVLGVYSFGIATDPTVSAISDYLGHGTAGTQSTGGEKFNSRSPASLSTLTMALITPSVIMVVTSNNLVSFQSWRGDYRRLPLMCTNYEDLNRNTFISNRNTPTSRCGVLVYSEGQVAFTRNFRRSRSAYFAYGANDCCLHKVTGGGAFEWTSRPHFLNDGIAWIDERAWDLGFSQTDAWSMQLFGPSGPTTIEADGASDGTCTASFNSAAIFAGAASAPGTSTTSYVGASVFCGVASSVGTSNVAAISAAIFAGVASAAGTSAAAFDSLTVSAAIAASAGTGAATAVSVSFYAAVSSATGTSTVTGTASAIFAAVASALGTSTAIADGEDASAPGGVIVEATGSCAGTSTVSGIGEDIGVVIVPPPLFIGGGAPTAIGKRAILMQADGYAYGISGTSYAGALVSCRNFGSSGYSTAFAYGEGIINLLPEELTALMEEL